MKRVSIWFVVSCLVIISMVLASCGTTPIPTPTPTTPKPTTTPTPTTPVVTTPVPPAPSGKPIYGGSLNSFSTAAQESWDPSDGTSGGAGWIGNVYEKPGMGDWKRGPMGSKEQTYDTIIWDNDKYAVGQLCESWEFPNTTTIVFHVRKGVKWQNKAPVNGRELTANDMVYSILRYNTNPVAPSTSAAYVDKIVVNDKYTYTVTLKKPNALAIYPLTVDYNVFIHPKEVVDQFGNLRDWKNANGTGPFILTDVVMGASATYIKNPDYWGYDELNPSNRLPYVDRIRITYITDKSTRLAALRTGKIDYMSDINVTEVDSIKRSSSALQWHQFLSFLNNPRVFMKSDEKPFNDQRVRWAMTMAIDFQKIIDTYLGGQGYRVDGPVWPVYKDMYTPYDQLPADIKELYSYNPTKAKQLLADAGYPNGFEVDYGTTPDLQEQGQILINYWQAIGVKGNMYVKDSATLRGMRTARSYKGLIAPAWGLTIAMDCLSMDTSAHGYNIQNLFDPKYDDLVAKTLSTLDPVERAKVAKEANLYNLRMAPHVRFPCATNNTAWWPWLNNFESATSLNGRAGGSIWAHVWIDQEKKKSLGF